jgi:hypothetical protein
MTENLLELGTEPTDARDAPTEATRKNTARPAGIPDKFWDEASGTLRTDALVKSYLELERKLSGTALREPPPSAEDYQIKITNEILANDPEVNRRLHSAGFTQDQAQLVYDLAAERLIPLVIEIAEVFESEGQIAKLVKEFGSEQRWRVVARQIDAWGRAHLPQRAFEALSTTYEGILAMHRMMTNDEPGLLREGERPAESLSDDQLKALMRDPRYWRDQEPTIVEQVREGFRRLYRE